MGTFTMLMERRIQWDDFRGLNQALWVVKRDWRGGECWTALKATFRAMRCGKIKHTFRTREPNRQPLYPA